MRNLLAGRRGYDHGPSLVRECRRGYEPGRGRARTAVCTLLANESHQLLADWNGVIRRMFNDSLGTSMDYPNLHRKLFKGGAAAYTELWTRKLHEAKAAGIRVGVIAVLHQGSLEAGPERFYRYFTGDLGLTDFQVNTPFPGGPAKEVEGGFQLDSCELADFMVGLFDIWMAEGYSSGVSVGPFNALIDHF